MSSRLSAKAAEHIGLALGELATNATKYGALSLPKGRVEIRWDVEIDDTRTKRLRVTWQEVGGPRVHETRSEGFRTCRANETCSYVVGWNDLAHVRPRRREMAAFSSSGFRSSLSDYSALPQKNLADSTALASFPKLEQFPI